MGYERVLYDRYEIPVIEGYEYLFDKQGDTHILPGQVRVVLSDGSPPTLDSNTTFIKILEQIKLN